MPGFPAEIVLLAIAGLGSSGAIVARWLHQNTPNTTTVDDLQQEVERLMNDVDQLEDDVDGLDHQLRGVGDNNGYLNQASEDRQEILDKLTAIDRRVTGLAFALNKMQYELDTADDITDVDLEDIDVFGQSMRGGSGEQPGDD